MRLLSDDLSNHDTPSCDKYDPLSACCMGKAGGTVHDSVTKRVPGSCSKMHHLQVDASCNDSIPVPGATLGGSCLAVLGLRLVSCHRRGRLRGHSLLTVLFLRMF